MILLGSVLCVPLADSLQLGMNMVVAMFGLIVHPIARKLLRSGLLLGTGIELIFLVALKPYEMATLLHIVGVMPLGRFLTVVVSLKTELWPSWFLRVNVVVVVTFVMTVLVDDFTLCVRGTPPRVLRTNLIPFRLKARYVPWNAEMIRRALLCGSALLFLLQTSIRVV